jgi:hypothetical protein
MQEQENEELEALLSLAKEDEEACLLLDEGRRSLYLNQESETGYTDSFLEADDLIPVVG